MRMVKMMNMIKVKMMKIIMMMAMWKMMIIMRDKISKEMSNSRIQTKRIKGKGKKWFMGLKSPYLRKMMKI